MRLFKSYRLHQLASGACTVCLGLTTIATPVTAAPVGGSVTAGSGQISQSGTNTQIQQNSDRLVIEWQGFDTLNGESVTFNQPDANAWALNRVLSGQATSFDGSLFANGNVIITNGSGIHFGPNAHVDVNSLIASVPGITDSNFMAGNMVFDQIGTSDAMVTNAGTITAKQGGLAALVAPGVENSGLIRADLGTVVLGGGEAFALDFYGDKLIQFAVTEPTKSTPKRADGSDADAIVSNSGTVQADGGTVVMTAKQAGAVLDNAINMSGVAQANSVSMHNGRIVLGGGGAGRVRVTGKLVSKSAPTPAPALNRGAITVTGQDVEIADGATLDASGTEGGGTILIGADDKGALIIDSLLGTLGNAETTTIAAGASIDASSTDGDGGHVVVWGDNAVNFHGLIDTMGGDNGFVEVSTHGTGVIDGTARTGSLLIDPQDVCIQSSASTCDLTHLTTPAYLSVSTITNVLSDGGDVTITTKATDVDGNGTADGGTLGGTGRVLFANANIKVDNNSGTMGTLSIYAADWIDTGETGFQSIGTTGTNYEFYAGSSAGTTGTAESSAYIKLYDQIFETGGGHVIFDAADDVYIRDPLKTSGGDVTLIARGGDAGSNLIFGGGADGYIDTTDGNGNAGAVSISADTITVNTTADPIIKADGTGGTVSISSYTSNKTIDLGSAGTSDLVLTSATLDKIQAETLRVGDASSRDITATDLDLSTVSALDLTSAGNVTFNGTVDGDFDLTVNSPGTTAFNGKIGGTTRLGSLTTDAGGTTLLNSYSPGTGNPSMKVSGDITFNDAVDLGTDTSLESKGSITFNDTLDSQVANQAGINLTFSGNGILNGAVGGDRAIRFIQVNTTGTTQINGGLVNAQVLQDYYNKVLLGADTTLSTNSADKDVIFRKTVNGGYALNINSSGTTAFMGAVGDTIALKSLTTDAAGTTLLNGGTINVSGNTTTFNDAVILGTDTSITDAGAVAFNSTVDSETGETNALTVNAGGNVGFGGIVGGTDKLSGLSVSSGGTVSNSASITTDNGNIGIAADDMTIGAAIDAGTGIVTLAPYTVGREIDLGTKTAGKLGLTDAELDLISAGTLEIGSADAGAITVSGAISPAGAGNLSLISGDAINVDNGANVTTSGALFIDAPTVNLDGNLTAGNGITGTAATINVLGSTGGAELQDAVDAAKANADVSVHAGTYAHVNINKAGLTMTDVDGTVVVTPASPAITISASGVTVDGFSYSGAGADPAMLLTAGANYVTIKNGTITGTASGAGIRIDNSVTSALDLLIDNLSISGVAGAGIALENTLSGADVEILNSSIAADGSYGIFAGNIAGGHFVIADNTLIKGQWSGINLRAISGGAEIGIAGNSEIRGASLDGIDILGVNASTLVIAGNNMINGQGSDGIFVSSGFTDSTVTIGSGTVSVGGVATSYGGNGTILGRDDGVDPDQMTNTVFRVADNGLIQGTTSDGLEFDNLITSNSDIQIENNGEIKGGADAVVFQKSVTDSAISIAGNTNMTADNNGIEFQGGVDNTGVTISDNAIAAGSDGIKFTGVNASTVMIADNSSITATTGRGVIFYNTISGGSDVSISRNDISGNTAGIQTADIDASTIAIADNSRIVGNNGQGIMVFGSITDASGANGVSITGNAEITGSESGIVFDFDGASEINNSNVTISDNTDITGNTRDGIRVWSEINNNSTFTVADNTGTIRGDWDGVVLYAPVIDSLVQITGNAAITATNQDGIVVDQPMIASSLAVTGNTAITGGDDGINLGPMLLAAVDISNNTAITGIAGSGIEFDGPIGLSFIDVASNGEIRGKEHGVEFDTDYDFGGGTIDLGVVASVVNITDNPMIVGETGQGILIKNAAGSVFNVANSTATGGESGLAFLNDSFIPQNPLFGIDNALNLDQSVFSGTSDAGLRVVNTSLGGIAIDLANANSFTGTPSMYLSGPRLSLVGDTLGSSAFNSVNGGYYIVLADTGLFDPGKPTIIDGDSATFDGAKANPTNIVDIENRIHDYDDDQTVGQIFFRNWKYQVADYAGVDYRRLTVSNIHAPGDHILRPNDILHILPQGEFGDDYSLGTCVVVKVTGTDAELDCALGNGVASADLSTFLGNLGLPN